MAARGLDIGRSMSEILISKAAALILLPFLMFVVAGAIVCG